MFLEDPIIITGVAVVVVVDVGEVSMGVEGVGATRMVTTNIMTTLVTTGLGIQTTGEEAEGVVITITTTHMEAKLATTMQQQILNECFTVYKHIGE